jgi:predicted membrane-bound spermidine synthase
MAWKEQLLFYKESPYQRIAFFTEADGTFSLTLNDFWQFNSGCEHIYHECLFTMPGLFPDKLENVLVLGGGDGLGARELLRYKSVQNIELVDLDPEIIKFAKTNVFMKNLNKDSFNNPKVKITVTDAKKWLSQKPVKKYDLIIIDFPDPTSDLLWSLYTVKLYKQVSARLKEHGIVSIQSSTYNTKTFELIYDRLEKVFPYIIGYHTGASSVFCGFFLCSQKPIKMSRKIPAKCRWINPRLINQLLGIPIAKDKHKEKSGKTVNVKKIVKGVISKEQRIKKGKKESTVADISASEFVRGEAVNPLAVTGGPPGQSLLTNPLIIGGVLVAVSVPLLLKIISKGDEDTD